MKKNIIRKKSFLFSLAIIKLYRFLCEKKKEYVLSKQVLRSGTSIGALVRESEHAESKLDFIHKMGIALKEANETEYWLELLFESEYIDKIKFESIQKDIQKILKLLISIIKSAKNLSS